MNNVEEIMEYKITKSTVLNRLMYATQFNHVGELIHVMQINTVFSSRHEEALNDGYMLLIDTMVDYPELQGATLYESAKNLKKAFQRNVLLDNPKMHNIVTILIAHIRTVIEKQNKKYQEELI